MPLPTQELPTPAERQELRMLIQALRAIAEPCGPSHSFWEVIADLEALGRGDPLLVPLSTKAHIVWAQQALENHRISEKDARCCRGEET